METPKYKKCQRCEINYIKYQDEYCPVCLAEMKLISKNDDVDDDLELCPICGQNFIHYDQIMCGECSKKRLIDQVDSDDEEEGTLWGEEIDSKGSSAEDDDEVEIVSLSELEEDEDYIDDDEDDEIEDSDKFDGDEDDDFDINLDEVDDEDEEDFDEEDFDEEDFDDEDDEE